MTNDDKLRRLREWIEDCHRDSEQDGDRAHPKQVGMRLAWRMVRAEIDRLLAEQEQEAMTTNDKLRRLLDRAKALRGTVDGWPTLIEEIEEIEAMASEAAPPVTDAEMEAVIETHADEWHRVGRCRAQNNLEECEEAKLSAAEMGVRLRALIARRVQQANAAAEELARAVETFRDDPTAAYSPLYAALAAFRAAQGGAS